MSASCALLVTVGKSALNLRRSHIERLTLLNHSFFADYLSCSQLCDELFNGLHLNKVDYQEILL
jgi:hypothetical protein